MTVAKGSSDKTLVDKLIAALEGFSDAEAGLLVGLSYQTIANYRAGNWKRLEHATRRRIAAFLALGLDAAGLEARLAEARATAEREAAAREGVRALHDQVIEGRERNGAAGGARPAKKRSQTKRRPS